MLNSTSQTCIIKHMETHYELQCKSEAQIDILFFSKLVKGYLLIEGGILFRFLIIVYSLPEQILLWIFIRPLVYALF